MAAPISRTDLFSRLDLEDRADKFLADAMQGVPKTLSDAGYSVKAFIASKRYGLVCRFDGSYKEKYTVLEVWATHKGKTTLFRYASSDIFWDEHERTNHNSATYDYISEDSARQSFGNMAMICAMSREEQVTWNWGAVPGWRKEQSA